MLWHLLVVSFVFTKKCLPTFEERFWNGQNFSAHFMPLSFFFAATTTFFDLKSCFLFLWPTNCSNWMCMKWHNFWCLIGCARAKSLGGAYMPLPAWNRVNLGWIFSNIYFASYIWGKVTRQKNLGSLFMFHPIIYQAFSLWMYQKV